MAKKKKNIKIIVPAEKVYEAQKPRYNPHQGGTGGHKSKKDYSRKQKHRTAWE